MPPPLASFYRREDHPQQWMVEDIPLRCSKALSRRKGLSSGSLTADSSLCGGNLLASFPAKPPLKGEVPAIAGRRGPFPQRQQVTNAPTFRRNHLCRSSQLKRQPLFGREREEGKDSHSRQWRLSMAVFLNRNKRPQAAPIEVAELLSEKPPPSHIHVLSYSSGEGVWGRGASLREAASPPESFPNVLSSGGSAREGASLQRSPLPRNFFSLFLLVFNGDSAVEMGDFGGDHFPNVAGA